MNHPFDLLQFKGSLVEIDVEMVPIIRHLWSRGIETDFCCQGDDDKYAYISFPNGVEFLKFVELCGGMLQLFSVIDHLYVSDASHRKGAIAIYFHNSDLPVLHDVVFG